MNITADQVRNLWNNGGRIDRGDDHAPITQDDLSALIDAVDTDDHGDPLDTEWEILADQLNGNEPGEPTSGQQHHLLAAVEDAAAATRDAAKDRTEDRDERIRSAIAAGVPVITIAKRAGLSRARVYQIRDGRR